MYGVCCRKIEFRYVRRSHNHTAQIFTSVLPIAELIFLSLFPLDARYYPCVLLLVIYDFYLASQSKFLFGKWHMDTFFLCRIGNYVSSFWFSSMFLVSSQLCREKKKSRKNIASLEMQNVKFILYSIILNIFPENCLTASHSSAIITT